MGIMYIILNISFLLLTKQILVNAVINALLEKSYIDDINGILTTNVKGSKFTSCITDCTRKSGCFGVLYNVTAQSSVRCKHLHYGNGNLNVSVFHGYDLYILNCYQLGMEFTTYYVKSGWVLSCPKLYFSLDSLDTGIAHGPYDHIDFIGDGKFGKSLSLYNHLDPEDSSYATAYLDLGTYPPPEYCFLRPDSCPDGVSYSFWLNILNPTNTWQGFITSKRLNGLGFAIYWENHGTGIGLQTSDLSNSRFYVPRATFESMFDYNIWLHYTYVYKYDAGHNLQLYISGNRMTTEFDTLPAGYAPNDDSCLYLGKLHTDEAVGIHSSKILTIQQG